MMKLHWFSKVFVVCAILLAVVPASAQTALSGSIAGVVRDISGGVLPGVTVEASSPALIERTRTVVTDDQGVYRIVGLVPGTYTVTFSLAGFSTVKREGLELTTGFTAQVNAELTIGAVEETLTVSASAPLVDTQNVMSQSVFSDRVLDRDPERSRPLCLCVSVVRTHGKIAAHGLRPASTKVGLP